MADEVQGIAILDDRGNPERLFLYCVPGDSERRPLLVAIPIKRRGSTEPEKCWDYDEQGEMIHVTPSVRVSTTKPDPADPSKNIEVELFHNGGDWRVRFERVERTPENSAYEQFKRRNGDFH